MPNQHLDPKFDIIYFAADTGLLACEIKFPKCHFIAHSDWHNLVADLTPDMEYLAIHIDTFSKFNLSVSEWAAMMLTTSSLIQFKTPLTIRVIIKKDTPVAVIRQLKKTSISGILLDVTQFDIDAALVAMDKCLTKEAYWPKHIIDMLPGNKKPVVESTGKITLTTRQQEVLTLLCQRGISNKLIGKMLSISDNTVKVHISAIMKAYNVRTRTQLVVLSATT